MTRKRTLRSRIRDFFTGPVGPIGAAGLDGQCECADRVLRLESLVEGIEDELVGIQSALGRREP